MSRATITENKKEAAMESKYISLGSSLKVPMVQELAKTNLDGVPSRYIRSDHNHHHHLTPPPLSSSPPQIPVIDMQKLFHPDFMDSELNNLHSACKEWGFFHLINHGVESEVVEKMKLETQAFFDLPIQEKNKFLLEEGDIQGYGQIFVFSDDQKLDWADLFYIITSPAPMRKPNLIPSLPTSFREAIEAYSYELQLVTTKMLNMLTKATGMRPEETEALFGGGGAMQSMRMNYYPPCPQPELVTGFSPHSDAAALTVLLQANETDGLQINKDGIWIPVSPIPGAFIMNTGDIFEIVTNGAYRSMEHRAVVSRERERITIALFVQPKLDGEIGPAASFLRSGTPAKFKRIGMAEYLRGFLAHKRKGKSYLDAMRVESST